MATKRTFSWDSGATGSTSAIGYSSDEGAPHAYKVVEAYLDANGTAAAITVFGSISGGDSWHQLDTLTLSGASGEDTYEGINAYDRIRLQITGITGTVVARVRSTE